MVCMQWKSSVAAIAKQCPPIMPNMSSGPYCNLRYLIKSLGLSIHRNSDIKTIVSITPGRCLPPH